MLNDLLVRMLVGCAVLLAPGIAGPVRADDVKQLKSDLAALKAQVQKLQAEVDKLKKGARPRTSVSEEDKKWIKTVVDDFFVALMAKKLNQAKKFVKKELHAPSSDSYFAASITDPFVKIQQEWGTVFGIGRKTHRRDGSYKGPRRVTVDALFEKHEITSQAFSPDGKGVLIKGTFAGNKALPPTDNYESESDGLYRVTRVIDGKLGPRTGTFVLHLSREAGAGRWEIDYFHWEVNKPKE